MVIKEETGGSNLMFGQLGIDKKNKIQSLEDIGWADPEKKDSLAKALKAIQNITFDVDVYSEQEMSGDKPPACKFIPTPKVMKSIVKVVAQNGHKGSVDKILHKFGDFTIQIKEEEADKKQLEEEDRKQKEAEMQKEEEEEALLQSEN